MYQLIVTIGIVMALITNAALASRLWRAALFVSVLPGIVLALGDDGGILLPLKSFSRKVTFFVTSSSFILH